MWSILSLIVAVLLFGGIWLQVNVISKLPNVNSIQDMVFSETTIIQDRNGKTLYKIFNENRDYIPYQKISPNMVNAIVAIEDKNYWTHNGLDAMGLLKVAFYNFTHPSNMRGGSTIPQQLLKNLLLNKDGKRETFKERVIRKLKEFFLTSKLSDSLERQIVKEQGKSDKETMHTEVKKKTLELYLNYISFGNNAYGIEAASKVYFGKPAIDLNIMEASILASLPKGPSYFNPYRHSPRTMGSLIITEPSGIRIS
ncbi:MAG: transglycosylase domain-containing protein [bacterium]|nr:transglycosylase domain-containing protein [bacterium]